MKPITVKDKNGDKIKLFESSDNDIFPNLEPKLWLNSIDSSHLDSKNKPYKVSNLHILSKKQAKRLGRALLKFAEE